MAEYISTTPQTLTAGSAAIFQSTVVKGGCNIWHHDGTASVTLRGSACPCRPSKYHVTAHVTITAPAATPVQIALAEDGIIAPETLMAFPAVTEGTVLSASTGKTILADACCEKLTLVAITDAVVNTALLSVDKLD